MHHRMKTSILALAAICSLPAAAQSLQEQRRVTLSQDYLDKAAVLMNQSCGTNIRIGIDAKTFSSIDGHIDQSTPAQCEAALDGIRDLCDDAAGKKAVAAKIQNIVCGYGGPNKRSIELRGGTVRYMFDFDAGNSRDFAHDQLEKKL